MVPHTFASFDFAGHEFVLTDSRALYWPAERALLVADLHLEKASFYAVQGQMLPPYDSRETLERLALAIRDTGARRVFTLGDNFHDPAGPSRMEPHAAGMLAALTCAVDWVWLTGNHDERHGRSNADAAAALGGEIAKEAEIAGIVLRHQAQRGEHRPELSGHFHPRLQLTVHQRHIRRPCAVIGQADSRSEAGPATAGQTRGGARMILPAFGALTGGMDAADPAIVSAMQPACTIDALLVANGRLMRFALWRPDRAPEYAKPSRPLARGSLRH